VATTIQLIDGTNTVDLNDGSAFSVQQDGLQAPVPALKTIFGGDRNLSRAGARIKRGGPHQNRIVTVWVDVLGSSNDVLATNVQSVEAQLRRAQEFAAFGLGAQMQLKLQWNSATNAVFFNVLTGTFDALGPNAHGPNYAVNTRLNRRRLDLICEPYAVGTQESLENLLDNAAFELGSTAAADWTDQNLTAAAETTITDGRAKAAKITANASGAVPRREQAVTVVTATAYHFSIRIRGASGNNQSWQIRAVSGGNSDTQAITSNDSFAWYTVNLTSDGTTLTVYIETTGSVTDTDDILYLGKSYVGTGSSRTTAWVSGRDVKNHWAGEDDDAQASTKRIDIEDIPGDVPAGLQVKAAENEIHTKLWLGARHVGRQRDAGLWHEGEDLAGLGTVSDSNSSDTNYGSSFLRAVFDATADDNGSAASATHTLSHTCSTEQNRCLLVWVTCVDATETAPSGVTYNSVAMTKKGSTATNGTMSISLWQLVAPATGANNIVATFGTACDAIHIGSLSFYGVNQTTPLGTAATATGSSVTPSVNVACGVDDVVTDGATIQAVGTPFTPGSGQTERWDRSFQGSSGADVTGSTERATGTTTTMDHTVSTTGTSGAWAIIGVAVNGIGGSGKGSAAATPAIFTVTITTPSRGQYRVVARLNEQGTAADIRVGVGYAYGDITSDPSVAADYQAASGSEFHILDLGTLTIPPLTIPDNMTIGSFTVRLAVYSAEASNYDDELRLDWVFLVPVDFGSGYVSKSIAQDVILGDSISDTHRYVLLNTSDVVQSAPAAQGGDPPEAHPAGTRLYFVSDDGAADKDDGWTVSLTYEPRFLSVAGT